MLAILFILLAAFFKACSDTMAHHFATSVFRWKDPRFWNAEVSWQYAPVIRFTGYKWDGWHLSNSLMIVCIALAVAFHTPLLRWYCEVLVAGALWNLSFNLFYNHVLRRK